MIKTVIMAGGRGARIAKINSEIPKPMLPINGKPVLEHQIECLKAQGVTDFIITVGHLKDAIINYFGNGEKLGVNIDYFEEEVPLGNAGALRYLGDKLKDDFLLINGDIMFDIDVSKMLSVHKNSPSMITLYTHPNSHPYDSGLIVVDKKTRRVVEWLTKEDIRPEYYKNNVNAGIHIISPSVLVCFPEKDKVDLDRDIIRPLISGGKVFSYQGPEYIKDMGTPERYEQVEKDYQRGIVSRKSLRKKQKAIFLDRDGTINKDVGFLNNIEQFELLPNVSSTIREINNSEYLAIVITNQPVIARGEATIEELERIHEKMETLLSNEGAYLDDIFYCPHHPDRGFEGEVLKYKIICDCRKPKPGLLLQAAEKYNIDLEKSWMIGDSERDMQAGKAAGCGTIFINESKDLETAVREILVK